MPRRKPLPPDWKPLLTPDDVAALLEVSRDTVDALVNAGHICAIDLGKGTRHSYRIPARQLLDDLDSLAREETESRRHPLHSVKKRGA